MSTGSTTSPSATWQSRSRSSPLTRAAMTPGSAGRAAPAVVPASTTCSLPARVIRSCWLDTVCSFGLNRTGYQMLPAVSAVRVLRGLRGLRYQPGPAQRVGQRPLRGGRVLGAPGTARTGTGAGGTNSRAARSGFRAERTVVIVVEAEGERDPAPGDVDGGHLHPHHVTGLDHRARVGDEG